jgi:hypothetical protein
MYVQTYSSEVNSKIIIMIIIKPEGKIRAVAPFLIEEI